MCNFFPIFVVAFALAIAMCSAALVTKQTQKSDARMLKVQIAPSIHKVNYWVSGGPCQKGDFECMNAVALSYVNNIRSRAGRAALGPGNLAMLDNAMAHSKEMRRAGRIYHQSSIKNSLGCTTRIAGENVAQNHEVLMKPKQAGTDPAKMCVEQFRNSPPHYKNQISSKAKFSVMGVVIGPDGKIWCTQTFTKSIKFGAGKCKKVPTISKLLKPKSVEANRRKQSAIQIRASTGHIFNIKELRLRRNGGIIILDLECSDGKCRYCHQNLNRCMTEKRSISFDKSNSPSDRIHKG